MGGRTPPSGAQATIDFISSLNKEILDASAGNAGTGETIAPLGDKIHAGSLDRHIEEVDSLATSHAVEPHERAKLDALGTKLWNTCTRLLRSSNGNNNDVGADGSADGGKLLLSHVRVLAFLALECGAGETRPGIAVLREGRTDDVRLLKVALRTAKGCIGFKQLDLSLKVLEKAAIREESLSSSHEGEQADAILRLSSEYYLLRINLAWQQDRLDLAEHMFSKVSEVCMQQNPSSAGSLAELLYDIGRGLIGNNEYSNAEMWLSRAVDILSQSVVSHLGQEAQNLRFCLLHALARSKLAQQKEPDSATLDLLAALKRDYDQELPVLVLTLEVIRKQRHPDAQGYYDCLNTITKTALMVESNFKMIIGHICQLRDLDVALAIKSMEQLVLCQLGLQMDTRLLEKGIVTFISMVTSPPEMADGLESLVTLMKKINDDSGLQISAEATHACLILIWKKIGSAFSQKEYDTTVRWCRLALQPVFENAGEKNKSKLHRKIILSALATSRYKDARQTFLGMSVTGKEDPLTRYLMYRVALQEDDIVLARDCLEILCRHGSEASTYLLACVAEAQRSDMRHQAAIVLQQLVDKLDGKPLYGIHLPALLRCTARLLMGEITDDQSGNFTIIEQICRVFEGFRTAASQAQLGDSQFALHELEWFSRNCYNLVLQYCTTWEPEHVLRLLNSCTKILDLYPSDIGSEALADVTLRRLFCDFIGGVIHVAQARMEEDFDTQRNHYLDARLHIQRFRGTCTEQLSKSDNKTQTELQDKYRTLLAFDFEAAVRLGQWNSLSEIVHEAREIGDEKLFSIFADSILCSGAPVDEISQVFQMIFRVVNERATHDMKRISRWLRCLFQLALDSNVQTAEEVLEHAYTLARDQTRTKRQSNDPAASYPQEELEWLATTAFNRAIDFYLTSDDAASRRWCKKAFDIAGLMCDNGTLCHVLREKYSCLRWED